jgi:putative flavoprotein involved in K+ transport
MEAEEIVPMSERIETVIVGGGQAGLALSYHLTRAGRDHVVLDSAPRVAETWRSQRWDSFSLVTPNWTFRLPGATDDSDDPDGFLARDEVVARLERYPVSFGSPLRLGVTVSTVERVDGRYRVYATGGAILADNVVVATGLFQQPRLPAAAADLPPAVAQRHSRDYRRPDDLPPGAVLVVGTAQSGCQIAEELYQAGRRVYLSVGRATRVPRRYRGRDIMVWLREIGFFARTVDQLPTPRAKFASNPHVSGRDGGRTLNLHRFAGDGVTLLGHIQGVRDGALVLANDLAESLAAADRFEADLCRSIDDLIARQHLDAPVETLPTLRDGYEQPTIEHLDLAAAGITSVIFATGYRFDFGLVRLPIRDADGFPIQRRGVTGYPGLYYLGMPWLHTIASGLFYGVGDDAAHVVEQIVARRDAPA